MFEKVNPSHPDKVADRIAGAIVDLAYQREENPRVAVEVLIGHGYAYIIIESSVTFSHDDVEPIVQRIAGNGMTTRLLSIPQDQHLADNQDGGIRCGDNGIFKGEPVSTDEKVLTSVAGQIYKQYPYDGKYIISKKLDEDEAKAYDVVICQSHLPRKDEKKLVLTVLEPLYGELSLGQLSIDTQINPLGEWTGGPDVDCGATNRKLGSDMGRGVTGGGLHGKDLSKADVSMNILCHILAQELGCTVTASCAIGDDRVKFRYHENDKGYTGASAPYAKVVEEARKYIKGHGGFEKFAEWGLIRPE